MVLWGKCDDMIVHEEDPFNAEPPRTRLAEHRLTPIEAFYGRNHGPIPRIDEQAWRLRVDGLVSDELTLSLADLRSCFTELTLVATLQCAGNRRAGLLAVREIPGEHPWGSGATSTAAWTGVRLADVLAVAGPRLGAAHVAFSAPDVSQVASPPQPFGGSVGLATALEGDVLLAWAMNGQPLPTVHGAPVRVVVPGHIGARSVKWVDRVTVEDHPSDNYFQATAYRLLPADADPSTADAGDGLSLSTVAVNADILRPDDGATLAAGINEVAGYAFVGDGRGIARVDVSADGGASWSQAQLDRDTDAWAWRRWRTTLDLAAGEVEVLARAWDTAAAVQPESPAHLWNPKGYANTAWARVAVTVR